MDIINKAKEKIIDHLLQTGLLLLAFLLTALAFLLDQIFEIQQTISKLSPLLLLKTILLLLAVVIFLVTYILYKRPKYKFTRFNDLLWLHNEPVPFCLRCFEANNKAFHMFVKIEGNPPRYKCQHCGYYPKASKHPDDPMTSKKTTQQVNQGDGE
jgi:hypothetical protein